MLRVRNLDRALEFYVGALGMQLVRREDYSEGRFTLAFVGFGPESEHAVLELTHNWDRGPGEVGDGFGHVAIGVADLEATYDRVQAKGFDATRPPGPMKHVRDDGRTTDRIAFIRDPDGYAVELIEQR